MPSAIAIDCEMVLTSLRGTLHEEVARVAFIDEDTKILLDEYIKPRGQVIDYRSSITGILPRHIECAPTLSSLRDRMKSLIKNKLIVGHSVRRDLECLDIKFKENAIRDTSELPIFLRRNGGSKKLRELAREHLDVDIQQGTHCPKEDALCAMALFLLKWNLPGPAPRSVFALQNRHRNRGCNLHHGERFSDDGNGGRQAIEFYEELISDESDEYYEKMYEKREMEQREMELNEADILDELEERNEKKYGPLYAPFGFYMNENGNYAQIDILKMSFRPEYRAMIDANLKRMEMDWKFRTGIYKNWGIK